MPYQIEQKVVDPELELNNAQMTFQKLAPACSVAKRALGVPQLAPQEKQLGILRGELRETKLCISIATKGRHALHDHIVKKQLKSALAETEELQELLRDQQTQLEEVSCLNYLSQKKLGELNKRVMTESDELVKVENALNRLRQIENRLEIATKRFCIVNYDNACIRQDIQLMLVERKSFNLIWNRTIEKLVKGKLYLMDIFEIATAAFGDRDEACRKLDALKWQGLYGLNRDINEMQQYEIELNHLVKLEQFLRVKGSRRVCEADEKEERLRQEEVERCEKEIARHDALLNEIFEYRKCDVVSEIADRFHEAEVANWSKFLLLCCFLQQSISTRLQVEECRKLMASQREFNDARVARENEHLASLREELEQTRTKTQKMRDAYAASENKLVNVIKGIEDLVKASKADTSVFSTLLGPHTQVTRWNVMRFLLLLEREVKMLIQVAYSQLTPPTGKGGPAKKSKTVADPYFDILKPNPIERLVNYQPCAYCVEDYMMNLVFETPAEVATPEYIAHMLSLEEDNTPFGLYTLTIPARRHPLSGTKEKSQ